MHVLLFNEWYKYINTKREHAKAAAVNHISCPDIHTQKNWPSWAKLTPAPDTGPRPLKVPDYLFIFPYLQVPFLFIEKIMVLRGWNGFMAFQFIAMGGKWMSRYQCTVLEFSDSAKRVFPRASGFLSCKLFPRSSSISAYPSPAV